MGSICFFLSAVGKKERNFRFDKKFTRINKTFLHVHSFKTLHQLTENAYNNLLDLLQVQMTYTYKICYKDQPFSQRLFLIRKKALGTMLLRACFSIFYIYICFKA